MARSTALAEARSATVERVRQFSDELDRYAPSIEQALPAHIGIERFKRVLITAINANPDLLFADRRTLYNASVKCAADGLLPDGRDAALVIYNTKVKLRNAAGLDEEFRLDAVQYMPLIAGIRRRMQNSGEVLSAEAEVVCANDKFAYQLGDNPFIEHAPPALTEDRGDIIGAYAIIRLRSGEVIRDVMPKSRIEQARKQSRSPNGLMWDKFYDEGARKTVLRHASKQVPQSADIDRLLARDDEPPVIDEVPGLPAPALHRVEPEPPPPPPMTIEQDNEPSYAVMTLEGEEVALKTAGATAKALALIFAEAGRQGMKQLEGARESNEGVLQELGADDAKLFEEVIEDYNGRLAAAREAERRKAAPPPPTPPASAIPPPAAPAASAPAATSTDAPAGLSATGDRPPVEDVEDGTSQSWHYEPVMRNGKYDWRAWALGIFIPRIRRDIQDSTDFALCLADNEENLKRARLALHESDRQTLEQAIDQQWQTLGDG
jgi:recombination protein RecT